MPSFSEALIWNSLSATMLAVVLLTMCRFRFLQTRPSARCWLWLLVMIKLVTPPVVGLAILPATASQELSLPANVVSSFLVDTAPSQPARESSTSPVGTVENATPDAFPVEAIATSEATEERVAGDAWYERHALSVGLLSASILGTLAILFVAATQSLRLGRLLRRADKASPELVTLVEQVAARFRLKKHPTPYVVHAAVSPMLWGFGSSKIILPAHLEDHLDRAQYQQVIAHEIAHLVRRDHWVNLLAFGITSLFWWHPVSWIAWRSLRSAQEISCDAMAINAVQCQRRAYGETLLVVVDTLSEFRTTIPSLANGFGQSAFLKRRFLMLTNPRLNHRLSPWMLPLLLGFAAILPCIPIERSWGQDSEDADIRVAQTPAATALEFRDRADPSSRFAPGHPMSPEAKKFVVAKKSKPIVPYRCQAGDQLKFVFRRVAASSKPYGLQVGDEVQIESRTDAEIDRDLTVQPDGHITLPLLGQVRAAGKTIVQLTSELESRYGQVYRVPGITVTPIRVNSTLIDLLAAIDSRSGMGGQIVAPAGAIQLPAIGQVFVHGKTIEEVSRDVNAQYSKVVDGLETTAVLVQRSTATIKIVGEVNNPGRYELDGPTTVLQALELAGGWHARADLSQVLVMRAKNAVDYAVIDIRPKKRGKMRPRNYVGLQNEDTILVLKKSR